MAIITIFEKVKYDDEHYTYEGKPMTVNLTVSTVDYPVEDKDGNELFDKSGTQLFVKGL